LRHGLVRKNRAGKGREKIFLSKGRDRQDRPGLNIISECTKGRKLAVEIRRDPTLKTVETAAGFRRGRNSWAINCEMGDPCLGGFPKKTALEVPRPRGGSRESTVRARAAGTAGADRRRRRGSFNLEELPIWEKKNLVSGTKKQVWLNTSIGKIKT